MDAWLASTTLSRSLAGDPPSARSATRARISSASEGFCRSVTARLSLVAPLGLISAVSTPMLAGIGGWYSCRPGLTFWLGGLDKPLDCDADWGWVFCHELVATYEASNVSGFIACLFDGRSAKLDEGSWAKPLLWMRISRFGGLEEGTSGGFFLRSRRPPRWLSPRTQSRCSLWQRLHG